MSRARGRAVNRAPAVPASLQTRLARDAAASAKQTWLRHRQRCVYCIKCLPDGRAGQPCEDGEAFIEEMRQARAAVRRESAEDRKPPPDAVPLFTAEQCRGAS